MDNVEKYFEGERMQCTIGVLISIACISVSIYLLFLQKTMLKGMAFSLIPLSVLLLIICVAVLIRTPKDMERITTFIKTKPQKMKTEELPRMESVMKNFATIKKIEICFFLAGLLMTIFFWNNDLVKGIAIGLMIQGTILYLFDHIAEARGEIYFAFLKSL